MKEIRDLTVTAVERLGGRYVHLRLTDPSAPLPHPILPGQFVEVRIDQEPNVFLRRPISVNYVDRKANELWLLVAVVGNGTRRLAALQPGDRLNCVLPLGNHFQYDANRDHRVLLVGGGVGVAPLLYLGAELKRSGAEPVFLLGARTATDLMLLDEFSKYGQVCITTEDGSMGEKGFVTQHSLLTTSPLGETESGTPSPLGGTEGGPWGPASIFCCGPTPMMKAVARYAREQGIDCQVSLENMMACGLGACLCCVENTVRGHVCVCKEGPVFNINELLWQD